MKKLNASPKITSHTDRKESLVGANFVQTTIQVGGYKPSTVIDFEIPSQYDTATVKLYDILGKKVLEKIVSSTQKKINVSNLSQGVYFAKIEATGLSITKKIIKN